MRPSLQPRISQTVSTASQLLRETLLPTPPVELSFSSLLEAVGNNVASDSISPNGANNNLFTLFLHDSGGDIQLSAQNNGQVNNNPNSIGNGTGGEQDILTNLGVGTELTISIELSIVNGANNGIASTYIVTATGTDDAGNPVIATNIDDFTVSDMPITSVPEPTAVFLTILSLPVILRRKRHA